MKNKILILCSFAGFALATFQVSAQDNKAYINATSNAHVVAHDVNMGDVHWTSGFWSDRFNQAMEITIPAEYNYFMKKSEDNFRKVAGEIPVTDGSFGTNWQDGDYYKWLEAQVSYYAVHPSDSLLERLNSCAKLIVKAQDSDGYITTHTQIGFGQQGPSQYKIHKVVHNAPHFTERAYHETYNMGHLMTLATTYYRVTGSKILLDVAIKAADCIDKAFAQVTPEISEADFNPTEIMGLVELYRCTGDKKFLNLANRIVTGRGYAKTEFSQNATPFRKETHAVGHAVTGTVLYNGVADLYAETGDDSLLTSLKAIWNDMYLRKVSITGGLGNAHDEIDQKNPQKTVHEAFGLPYDLYNATAYNETCAALYGAYFCWRMFMITGDSKYVDQMEVGFYNDLSGISIDGKSFFYTNPLRWYGEDQNLLSLDYQKRWTDNVSCVCCPTSIVRFLTETNDYAYAVGDNSLFVTLYGSNHISTEINGNKVVFTQKTNYPWQGLVEFTYEGEKDVNFDLKLRIPHWAKGSYVKVNGEERDVSAGTFASINRIWKKGDKVLLNLTFNPRLVEANPKVEQLVNQVAVVNGPIVYCAESVDYIKPFVKFEDMMIDAKPQFQVLYKSQILNGINTIRIDNMYFTTESFPKGKLYVSQDLEPRRTLATFIPYYAWNNRGTGQMSVFFPIKW